MNDPIGSSDVRPEEVFVMGAWVRLLTDPSASSTDRGGGEAQRHSCDVPFSFACGTRSSREWLKLENDTRRQRQALAGQRAGVDDKGLGDIPGHPAHQQTAVLQAMLKTLCQPGAGDYRRRRASV